MIVVLGIFFAVALVVFLAIGKTLDEWDEKGRRS